MGNANSSTAAHPAGSGAGAGARRSRNAPAHPSSPSYSPSPHSSKPTTPSKQAPSLTPSSSTSAKPGGRRKKSIELSDVDPSLSFTSGGSSAGTPNPVSVRSGAYRKHADRMALGSGSAEEDELDPNEEAVGTLRGAMQGKAEHVVYGPRRDGRPPVSPTTAGSLGRGSAVALESSFKPESNLTVRPQTIALPSPSLFTQSPLVDPDDTIHPGFKASPRLTSDVLLSSDQMPVIVSPLAEDLPSDSPFGGSSTPRRIEQPTSLMDVAATIEAPAPIPTSSATSSGPSSGAPSGYSTPKVRDLLPPHTSPPHPPSQAPTDTVLAPIVPMQSLPIAADSIPSGTGVIASPIASPHPGNSPAVRSPAVLLPPNLLNAPVAAIPIPLLSVPSATIAASLLAAAVDVGAGSEGVPTLIKWKDEDGQAARVAAGTRPKQVFVTGTFANGWKTKIELRKTDPTDFLALISLPPGPHRLKFIVDKEWKASKHLPVATDADGNLINYLVVNGAAAKAIVEWDQQEKVPTAGPLSVIEEPEDVPVVPEGDDNEWTQEIPPELVEWGEWEAERDAAEGSSISLAGGSPPSIPPPPATSGVPPPSLPAQLEKGPLNHAAYVTQGSGDDNSILPKPDHSVINHLAASPIKGGFLSVGVTTRYKRKFVTIVYYKALASRD